MFQDLHASFTTRLVVFGASKRGALKAPVSRQKAVAQRSLKRDFSIGKISRFWFEKWNSNSAVG